MPRVSRIAVVEQKVVELDEKLTKFLTNDWVHAEAKATIMDIKLNMVLGAITITVLGVFVPLAVKLWSNWLN